MIRFFEENGALIAHLRNETIRIDGWGKNALRVRTTLLKKLPGNDHALTKKRSTVQRSLSTTAQKQPRS